MPSVWLLVVATALLWGSGGLVSKALIESGVDAFTVTAVPFGAGAILAWVVARRLPSVAAFVSGLLLGVISTAGPALLFNLGYETLPAGVVTLLIAVGPIITAIAAHFWFADERFTLGKGGGLAISLFGVAILSLGQGGEDGGTPIGVVLVICGSLLAGTTAVWGRSAAMRHGAKNLVPTQLTGAALTPVVMSWALDRDLVPTGGFQAWQLLGLVAIGFFASFLGFRMIMKANEIGTTGQVSLVGYLLPVVGVGGGAILFAEPVTASVTIGGVLILGGVLITGRSGGKPTRVLRSAG
ncbi:MAG: DMT family transporter [Acidimicrobiia bacterium]